MVDQDGIGVLPDGGIDQSQARGDTGNQLPHFAPPLHLQSIGSMVAKQCGLQQPVKGRQQGRASDVRFWGVHEQGVNKGTYLANARYVCQVRALF